MSAVSLGDVLISFMSTSFPDRNDEQMKEGRTPENQQKSPYNELHNAADYTLNNKSRVPGQSGVSQA